ncbi:NodT family RND efflux system outer membrane lipoprotein [Novosphingobium sp. Rr 2-17]|uniref:efflux transporter outer membrane subunit n=1 Tax=Novosphingobium sp. Rr 2-17 TaxID=555793 RepID=UPI000269A235|nr:efflux transporter outer membrane subunit [Novosphingobium sp. Rr 2-17]EIZ77857.1 NodT family RND efflux system outer membrane lipoprotein [Novosphingobium sp. Rr 2-17]
MNVLAAGLASCLVLTLGACTVGPNYKQPAVRLPTAWQAPAPHQGSVSALAGWWDRFEDPALVKLQQLAEANSPSLEQAIARIDQSRAELSSSKADALPSVTANGKYTQSSQTFNVGDQSLETTTAGVQIGADASWEIDLFGKVRRTNQAARARIDKRIDDWHDARVSLAAEVADTYAQLRGCEQLVDLYGQQSKSQGETARLTGISARAGFSAPSDAQLAEASAASIRSTYADQEAQCNLLVKSLVSLTGEDEAAVRALLAPRRAKLPTPAAFDVGSIPADLVRQRPDVASSERELAATSAEIGAAVADLYPSLSLSGSISRGGGSRSWSFGPTLNLPIFDGGKSRATVRSKKAGYALQLGTYREAVRKAVLEVEQALVRLDAARSREADADRAAKGYQASFEANDKLYRTGSSSLIDRESSFRTALDAQRSLVTLRTAQVQYWIALYKALGGGWDAADRAVIKPSTGVTQP